ncbi:YkvI family membrane protein [Megasphaera elsdenii]|uniref:YkvI family membrane protein n=1 Tax=Megasphaera elsdenii TaxID=907 RepID=UPI00339B4C9A
MANISSIKAASLSMCFSVGAVLFSSHAGGGFATGNQENVYFVSLGWLGPITAIITMLLFTLTIKEAMNIYNSRHLTSYCQLFQNLYSPFKGIEYLFEAFFYIMVLMAVSATISGAASAINAQTGLNYYAGIGIAGTIIFFLTIFGAGLVRRATTYMGMAILAMVIMIFSVGIYMGGSIEGTQFFTAAMAQDFATNGFSKVPTAILHAFTYSGFQCVVIPTMIVVGTPLVTRKNCATSMWFSFAMNAIALTLAVCMLLGWTGIYGKSPLPTLTSCKAMGLSWLTIAYSAFLLLCLISTGVTTVFGFTARFSETKCLKKVSHNAITRSAIVTLFIIIASMTVSVAGLTNIIKYGYSYCGYLAIAIIIVPFLTIGRYKNKRYIADSEYRTRIDAMNETSEATQTFQPTAEPAGH